MSTLKFNAKNFIKQGGVKLRDIFSDSLSKIKLTLVSACLYLSGGFNLFQLIAKCYNNVIVGLTQVVKVFRQSRSIMISKFLYCIGYKLNIGNGDQKLSNLDNLSSDGSVITDYQVVPRIEINPTRECGYTCEAKTEAGLILHNELEYELPVAPKLILSI